MELPKLLKKNGEYIIQFEYEDYTLDQMEELFDLLILRMELSSYDDTKELLRCVREIEERLKLYKKYDYAKGDMRKWTTIDSRKR